VTLLCSLLHVGYKKSDFLVSVDILKPCCMEYMNIIVQLESCHQLNKAIKKMLKYSNRRVH